MARRGGIGQNIAIRGDDVQFHARVEGHQPVKERFQRGTVDPALGVQNWFALHDLLRQAARETLNHGVTILHAAVELDGAGDGGTEHHQ